MKGDKKTSTLTLANVRGSQLSCIATNDNDEDEQYATTVTEEPVQAFKHLTTLGRTDGHQYPLLLRASYE